MKYPIIIAGPCAAESEQQVLLTAEGIAQCKAQYQDYTYIYRAGIWKPRTSPNTFQGIGLGGLKWLQEVQQRYGMPVAVEVATPDQVEAAVEAGVDYLWIGARTAANPIAVQAIADSITGLVCLKGIMIKNPVNEDADLWIGNIDRLQRAGVPVMAVHRGCNHRPCWAMVYRLVQERKDIPLIMDPSHLSGQASGVSDLCIQAVQMGYQGWMIETHIHPEDALSDARQQITPEALACIVGQLQVAAEGRQVTELDWLRKMMDEVDDDLWQDMARRMDISKRIGQWKKEHGVPPLQPSRYQQILQRRIEWGEQQGWDRKAVEQIMDAIHTESVRVQS